MAPSGHASELASQVDGSNPFAVANHPFTVVH